ncbi:MAG: ParB/RepB/Spo0J family partition protein [Cyanobacteria bacterium]|nr:ParB/RepB/Spo0J family partition protein [Cyanobacteriota bacterium]
MPLISIDKLHPDLRNANVLEESLFEKLKGNIQRTGFCPVCIVRPHPTESGHFIMVDGHHRLLAVKSLGWELVECQIVEIGDEEAALLLLTLNRLRGTDIPRKRAELIESLLPSISIEDLSMMLPECTTEIDSLLALLKQDQEALEKALKEQMAAEELTLPVPFGFMIHPEEAVIVVEALNLYQAKHPKDQGQALVAICRDVIAQKEGCNHG